MIFHRKRAKLDINNPNHRLKLQYQAMIQQGIMTLVGVVLIVMGFGEGVETKSGVVMVLCGFLLVMMGALRLYLCYRLFHDDFNEKDME